MSALLKTGTVHILANVVGDWLAWSSKWLGSWTQRMGSLLILLSPAEAKGCSFDLLLTCCPFFCLSLSAVPINSHMRVSLPKFLENKTVTQCFWLHPQTLCNCLYFLYIGGISTLSWKPSISTDVGTPWRDSISPGSRGFSYC